MWKPPPAHSSEAVARLSAERSEVRFSDWLDDSSPDVGREAKVLVGIVHTERYRAWSTASRTI